VYRIYNYNHIIIITLKVPTHPGSPRQRAVKRVCVCVAVYRYTLITEIIVGTVNQGFQLLGNITQMRPIETDVLRSVYVSVW